MKYIIEVKLNKDFVKEEAGKFIVGIKAKPIQGKANEEVIKKLAKHLKISSSSIKIITGHTSRKKLVEVL
jgi:uncharacterized protein YggU (UPF0235/DUF167 family)